MVAKNLEPLLGWHAYQIVALTAFDYNSIGPHRKVLKFCNTWIYEYGCYESRLWSKGVHGGS